MSEWFRVAANCVFFAALIQLFDIGKYALTYGWSGIRGFHLQLNHQVLIHCLGLLIAGAVYGILMVFGWGAFRGTPLVVLVAVIGLSLAIGTLSQRAHRKQAIHQ